MTTYMNYNKKNKDEDDMSLADIMSLKISTTPIVEEKNEWNDWSIHNEMYQKQLQSSYYQLQYLQQQQMLMMMNNNNSSRRSSTISSATSTSSNSSRYYYPQYYPISPSSSSTSSSIKHSKPRTNRSSIPVEMNITPPKRRQSLGKRIKKVFGMTEASLPAEIPNDKTLGPTKITNNDKKKANHVAMANNVTIATNNILTTKMPDSPNSSISSRRQHYYRHSNALPSPASSTVSTNSIKTNNTTTNIKKKKSLAFNSVIKVHETFSASEYDRRCDTSATCQKLTPVLALKIKEELNHFKLNDMFIHADSRKNTHFFM